MGSDKKAQITEVQENEMEITYRHTNAKEESELSLHSSTHRDNKKNRNYLTKSGKTCYPFPGPFPFANNGTWDQSPPSTPPHRLTASKKQQHYEPYLHKRILVGRYNPWAISSKPTMYLAPSSSSRSDIARN